MKDENKKINTQKVNEIIELSRRLLKIVYIFLILAIIYFGVKVGTAVGLWKGIINVLGVISPLFIGLIIAWLFNPVVSKLQDKGLKRGWGTTLIYLLFVGILTIIILSIVPQLTNQVTELSKNLPAIFTSVKDWINNLFENLSSIEGFDAKTLELELLTKLEKFSTGLASSLPETIFTAGKSFISGLGVFVVGLIIGFYLLVSFNDLEDSLIDIVPRKIVKKWNGLFTKINFSLRKYVQGALIDCTLVFVVTSIGLWAVGLNAPLLFGLFCGITNIIPYAGPYIGGAPAVIVAFSQNPIIGVLTLLVIVLIQFIEGNFLQPLIMSKITKLHPVTIMLGLLIFGYLWGIIGMLISTPLISVIKVIIDYLDEKYDILNFN